jgi:hypothetical protein
MKKKREGGKLRIKEKGGKVNGSWLFKSRKHFGIFEKCKNVRKILWMQIILSKGNEKRIWKEYESEYECENNKT